MEGPPLLADVARAAVDQHHEPLGITASEHDWSAHRGRQGSAIRARPRYRRGVRRSAVPSLVAVLTLGTPAAAVAPCHDVCHLAQGQPLLLQDARQLWVRRCDTAKDGTQSCVVQRTDLAGKVLVEKPAPTLFDNDFAKRELAGKVVVRLDPRGAWSDLSRPFELEAGNRKVSLSIDKDAVVCTPAGSTGARRALGCTPRTVQPYAVVTRGYGVIVAVAACAAGSGGEREVVATCEIAGTGH